MIALCRNRHRIVYEEEDFPSGCPLCNLHEILEGLQAENRGLKARVHDLEMEAEKSIRISVINQGLFEASADILKALENMPGRFNYPDELEDHLRPALASAEREMKNERAEMKKQKRTAR